MEKWRLLPPRTRGLQVSGLNQDTCPVSSLFLTQEGLVFTVGPAPHERQSGHGMRCGFDGPETRSIGGGVVGGVVLDATTHNEHTTDIKDEHLSG
jgi:hypothetical protein